MVPVKRFSQTNQQEAVLLIFDNVPNQTNQAELESMVFIVLFEPVKVILLQCSAAILSNPLIGRRSALLNDNAMIGKGDLG